MEETASAKLGSMICTSKLAKLAKIPLVKSGLTTLFLTQTEVLFSKNYFSLICIVTIFTLYIIIITSLL